MCRTVRKWKSSRLWAADDDDPVRFTATPVAGVLIVDADIFPDPRGEFVRAWVADEFQSEGLDIRIAQCSVSRNARRGTIRGLHFQTTPFDGAKTVRATRGAIFDVAVDLRPDSPTFCRWVGVELTDANRLALYVPAGCAHGYQTLVDDAEMLYFVSAAYAPDHQGGVRWDDPAFGIAWPTVPTMINERDRTYADFVLPRS
jgi:dTDP-4-dehydrorhamnose 3,5-epimerase